MSNQQPLNKDNLPPTWPFPTINGERTKESQELLDSKHYKTKEVLDTDDYEESPF
jgi:hypothetical protein